MLIEKGKIALDGKPEKVTKAYLKLWSNFVPFMYPRELKNPKTANIIDPYSGKTHGTLPAGTVLKYTSKIDIGDKTYFRSEKDTLKDLDLAIESTDLKEI